ncbi:hypothetical protein, partial [Leptotrichia wadei]|uniref:hypothetical protein n=1 Tax=Leptotrichia wadei TaxID=157687 RepID=UPI0028EEC347
EELGKYIWLTKADTSQEASASKSGSSSLILKTLLLYKFTIYNFNCVFILFNDTILNLLVFF